MHHCSSKGGFFLGVWGGGGGKCKMGYGLGWKSVM